MSGSAFGHTIHTDLPLQRLGPDLDRPLGRIEIVRSDPVRHRLPAAPTDPVTLGDPALLTTRHADDTVTIWDRGEAKFHLLPSAFRIVVRNEATDDEWENQLVNTALPLLLTSLGRFVLHGAAVLTDRGAVVFIGPSGRGKSTIAATAASLGRGVLADDGVLLTSEREVSSGFVGWRGPRHVRLVDSASGPAGRPRKHTLHLCQAQQAIASSPIASIVMLAPRSDSLSPLRTLDARFRVAGILANSFSVDERTRREQLVVAAAVAERVPMCQVSLPDDLDRAASALEAVLARLDDPRPSPVASSAP